MEKVHVNNEGKSCQAMSFCLRVQVHSVIPSLRRTLYGMFPQMHSIGKGKDLLYCYLYKMILEMDVLHSAIQRRPLPMRIDS